MDLCGLDEAFGLISQPSASCLGGSSTTESRKHDRKRAKKCRGPQLQYIESDASFTNVGSPDPDRPAVKRMESVPKLNPATGMTEHEPVDQDWGTREPFVGESGKNDLETIQKVVQGNNMLQRGDKPSYFGASPNDKSSSVMPGKKEGFEDKAAPYTNLIGSDTMYHDFTNDTKKWQTAKENGLMNEGQPSYGLLSSELRGLEAPTLPPPETSFNWKLAGQTPTVMHSVQPVEPVQPVQPTKQDDYEKQEILKKMDNILSRLDDMQYVNQENAQKEVLLFIMTGLGVLFVMDVACRAASRF
jgi:hypothetical protein